MAAVSMNIQMISPDGDFREDDVKNFIQGLPANQNITVVSIIGTQGTGKSYLLNRLFGTDFEVSRPDKHYGQATEGIWIAQCPNNPSMVVMDVEGFDSRERSRAEAETSFVDEAHALFALTISDVLLLNINCRALGQIHGGCLPLLQTILTERISTFRGRTRIVVTLRDCHNLATMNDMMVHKIIRECWESGPSTNRRLEDHIEVSVVQFPDAMNQFQSYEFERKLAELREKLTEAWLIPPQYSRRPLTSATFLDDVEPIWTDIRNNKALHIPSYNAREESVSKELEDCKQEWKHTEAEYVNQLQKLIAELFSKDNRQIKLESKIEYLENGNKLLQTKSKHREAEFLKQLQDLSDMLDSKDELQKKLESKIECLENKNKLLQTKFNNTEVEHLMHSQELRAEIDSKEDLQNKLESKIEYLENENKLLQTEFKNTEAGYLKQLQGLSVELDSKDDMQKKLESKIESLGNEKKSLQTNFKHIEVEHLMHSQELRAELDSKDDLQNKLESKIVYLEKKNVLLQTMFKEHRGRAFDALARIIFHTF